MLPHILCSVASASPHQTPYSARLSESPLFRLQRHVRSGPCDIHLRHALLLHHHPVSALHARESRLPRTRPRAHHTDIHTRRLRTGCVCEGVPSHRDAAAGLLSSLCRFSSARKISSSKVVPSRLQRETLARRMDNRRQARRSPHRTEQRPANWQRSSGVGQGHKLPRPATRA